MANKVQIGIDIGSTNVKIIKVEKQNPIKVVSALGAPIPSGSFSSDNEADQEVIAATIKKLLDDTHIHEHAAICALPESQVFTRVIEVPPLSEEELSSALRWQAEQYIPLPLSEVTMDFSIISKPEESKDKMKVLLVAAPLRVVNRQIKILSLCGLTATALETELIAVSRVFSPLSQADKAILIIDAGAGTTDAAVVTNGIVLFTRSIAVGGDAITRSIAENFNLSLQQAEEYKKAYGLVETELQGKVRQASQPIVGTMVDELKKVISYYQEKYSKSKLTTVVVCGGASLLPGFTSYLADHLGLEVQVGNPWEKLNASDPTLKISQSLASSFACATGLALRDFVS